MVAILAAIVLSVTTTLLLGGSFSFSEESAVIADGDRARCGGGCCGEQGK